MESKLNQKVKNKSGTHFNPAVQNRCLKTMKEC